jgi:outer membrane immunogenic protein
MKKLLLLTAFALGFVAGPAFAADIVPARVYKAPQPVYLGWTGFYVGVNGGWYGSTDNTITNVGTDTSIAGLGSALRLGLIPGAVSLSHNGFIGGGQIGYNRQVNPAWVVGIEADFDGVTGGKSSVASSSPGSPIIVPTTSLFGRELDDIGTVRGRIGYLSSPGLLWYATGGLAYGQIKIGSAWICPACTPPANQINQTSNTSVGWTVGAGLEWQFMPRWSVKLEYLYVDLGSLSGTIAYNYTFVTGQTSTMTSRVNERDNIVRVGLNYKFW